MFKNCVLILILTFIVGVFCQDFDEFDEEVFRELEEQNNAKFISDGLITANDKKFDGKFFLIFLFISVSKFFILL